MASVATYATEWCGCGSRLEDSLRALGVEWVEVRIERDPGAARFVAGANGGNHTAPTVVYPDEAVAVGPSMAQFKSDLCLGGAVGPVRSTQCRRMAARVGAVAFAERNSGLTLPLNVNTVKTDWSSTARTTGWIQ